MGTHRWGPGRYALGAAVVVGMAACSSGGSSAARPTTTSKATTTTTVPNPDLTKAATDEAAAILRALHDRGDQKNTCDPPGYETNITLPPEQHLPIPVVRATCVYANQQVQAIAFANPDDRMVWMASWTQRLCGLANKNGQNLLGATYWVVTPRAVTLTPTPDLAHEIVTVYGGEFHQENCAKS